MEFEIDDIFEVVDGELFRVSSVIHSDSLVYAHSDDEGDEIEFSFSEVITHWKKQQ